jgi:hypothetical protein
MSSASDTHVRALMYTRAEAALDAVLQTLRRRHSDADTCREQSRALASRSEISYLAAVAQFCIQREHDDEREHRQMTQQQYRAAVAKLAIVQAQSAALKRASAR